ncbi:uncharacterized protein L201_004376 [Kwoniella dendrophila CBS 6074]|uniref:Cystinosin n=1 Tax=Kwoniella dendrophila CBS 6074 TaxID=1295534 RepID=A0AAX4JVQ3_9TREE
METLISSHKEHPLWNAVVSFCGVVYFLAWSYSFYPQLILNYKRKSTKGLSPDFIYLNPLGFLALSIWSWGAYFSPIAREQYKDRHQGHLPQISKSDLAFSLHAVIISFITLGQVWWYSRKSTGRYSRSTEYEHEPLIQQNHQSYNDDTNGNNDNENSKLNTIISNQQNKPSRFGQIALMALFLSAVTSAILVWLGKLQFLDWLYLVSSIKLIISIIKYIPQIILNWKLRSSKGFAIGGIICDLIGSFFSFGQLVISSIFIEGDAGGIIANPAKLGLSFLSVFFDTIFIVQKYWLFRNHDKEDEREGGPGDEEE